MNKRASLSLPPPVSRDTGYKGGLFLTSSSFWTELQLGTTISCITSAYVRPEKGRRYADCSTRLPTPTDLGPRLPPIHEIILVHHLRASLVSRGCAPWITLTAVRSPYVSTWILQHYWNLLIRAASGIVSDDWINASCPYFYSNTNFRENRDSMIIFICNHSIMLNFVQIWAGSL